MIKILVWLLILFTNLFAVKKHIVFEAPYGIRNTEFSYDVNGDALDELIRVPGAYNVLNNKLFIDDWGNKRINIINLENKKNRIIKRKRSIDFDFIDKSESVFLSDLNLYKINKFDSLELISTFRTKRYENLRSIFEHPSGYKVVESTLNHKYFLDATFNRIEISRLKKFVENNGVLHFVDNKALLHWDFNVLKYNIKKLYYTLSGSNNKKIKPPIMEFPDSSEWGNFIKSSQMQFHYLGYDSNFNTYWRYYSDSIHVYKNMSFENGEPFFARIMIVFAYDRLGKLLYWFPEPLPEKYWKHRNRIRVNKEGRIFQLSFYSLASVPKNKMDKTKGIRIIEYIPEKKDMIHEERVKMYGKKRK